MRASPSRRSVSLLVIAGIAALLIILAPDVVLTLFAGVLLGVFLRAGGEPVARAAGIAPGWGVGLFLLAILLAIIGGGMTVAPGVAEQFRELVRQLPEGLAGVQERIEALPLGDRLLERIRPERLLTGETRRAAATAVTATFGAIGSFVLILFVGLYGALDPGVYRRGLRALLAPSLRAEGEAAMDEAAATLRHWLVAQLGAMTVVGVLTWLGLWALGIPLAAILGVIAGLLAFIPNIGPILAMIPGLLIAVSEGGSLVLWAAAVYIAVQFVESYLVTPLLQQQQVALPPAFVIAIQLLLGVLLGVLGLALATPLAAVGLALTRRLYVGRYLEREQARAATENGG